MKRDAIKNVLAEIPLFPETYWWLKHARGGFRDKFQFDTLPGLLPDSARAAVDSAANARPGKRVFVFSTLRFWIEHTTMLSLALAGQGHRVTLAYLPHVNWWDSENRFDLRRRDIYVRRLLEPAKSVLELVSLLDVRAAKELPPELEQAVARVSLYDTQYTRQAEDVTPEDELYSLRVARNREAARKALAFLSRHRPEVVIIPNGMILEFGVVYQVARHLGIKTVTYEFGEQSQHVWLAQDGIIMRHETDDLWQARKDAPLPAEAEAWLKEFMKSRQSSVRADSFVRLWQEVDRQGADKIRSDLGLDSRPVVLLATNVLGDSLTLGRQLITKTMGDWIDQVVRYFSGRPDVQLVVRIHPGENLTSGPSVAGVVHKALPELPDHIRLIGPTEKVNTYDLMDIASLGLVYTTTTGLEMATRGIPVMTAGRTHYRGRGFTIDAETIEDYFASLDRALADLSGHRLTQRQIELAWKYAFEFFHEFPLPFPWHIVHFAEDTRQNPMSAVLSPAGLEKYGRTFDCLAGEVLDWNRNSPDRM